MGHQQHENHPVQREGAPGDRDMVIKARCDSTWHLRNPVAAGARDMKRVWQVPGPPTNPTRGLLPEGRGKAWALQPGSAGNVTISRSGTWDSYLTPGQRKNGSSFMGFWHQLGGHVMLPRRDLVLVGLYDISCCCPCCHDPKDRRLCWEDRLQRGTCGHQGSWKRTVTAMMGRRKGEGAPGQTAETPRLGQGLCWSAGFAPGTGIWCRSHMLETHCRYSNERMVHSRGTETRAGCLVGDSPWLEGIPGFESRRKKGLSWTQSLSD